MAVYLSLFYAFSVLLVCSLFCLVLIGLVCCVNFGLIITFWVNCLHGKLSLFRLFVLLGTPAMLGVPFV